MNKTTEKYIHGYTPEEQDRLTRMNLILNERCRSSFEVRPGSKILDVGCGLGILARQLARETNCQVIGIEKSPKQIEGFHRLAGVAGERDLVELREGSAYDLPLSESEWGSFDLVYTRFLLEHVSKPQRVVDQMVQALKPNGEIVLIDDDHIHFQCYPPVPLFDEVWSNYLRVYDRLGA